MVRTKSTTTNIVFMGKTSKAAACKASSSAAAGPSSTSNGTVSSPRSSNSTDTNYCDIHNYNRSWGSIGRIYMTPLFVHNTSSVGMVTSCSLVLSVTTSLSTRRLSLVHHVGAIVTERRRTDCTQTNTDRYSGGNPICPREIPAWQKTITCFFPLKDNKRLPPPPQPPTPSSSTDGDKSSFQQEINNQPGSSKD